MEGVLLFLSFFSFFVIYEKMLCRTTDNMKLIAEYCTIDTSTFTDCSYELHASEFWQWQCNQRDYLLIVRF